MRIQSDSSARVVALSNLEAMLDRISGVCHRFYIEKVTPNRVTVGYSNPNEYGTPYPVFAVFPAWPNSFGEKETPMVALEYVRFIGVSQESEDWQAFEQIRDCPQLFRTQNNTWKTGYEIRVLRHPEFKVNSTWDKHGCIQTWHCQDKTFPSFRETSDWADAEMTTIERNAKA